MKKTDRVIRFLTDGLNKNELESKSRKYRKFEGAGESFYFIGKSGAVRLGRVSSKSFSISSRFHKQMEVWEIKNELNM